MLVAGNFGAAIGVGRTGLARLILFDSSPYPFLDNSFNPKVTKADGTVGGIHMA